MKIRKTTAADLAEVMEIYAVGRAYMRKNGNMEQWQNNYPPEELIAEDISEGISYVVTEDDDDIIAVFAFLDGPDITYSEIYEGDWPDNRPYKVIHRIAVKNHRKGIASYVFDYCLNEFPVIRIDTHKDNIPMRKSLEKNGFIYCGIIHLLNGDERLAFQKER